MIVVYDVETVTVAGRRRLRKVANICCAHGVRVQRSVFECVLELPAMVRFVDRLRRAIDERGDNLRIYHLGSAMPRIEAYGDAAVMTPRDPLVI